ncbi:MAG: GntR family transcriptional regulator [Desulfobacterales bacterium]|nr:GntR family transcriptional regulator [Desulfobacterales bacterium]
MNEEIQPSPVLNPQSPIPLYRQLADILSGKIRSGQYRPGDRIASEIEMARVYGIGRPTARQATESLIRKGLLTRKRGAGTFVQKAPKEVDLFSLGGTLASFQKKGVAIRTEILHVMRMVLVPPDAGHPFSGAQAYYFSRLSYADANPVLIEDIYLHAALFSGIDRIDLAGRSLSQAVEEVFFMRPTSGKQLFRAMHPSRSQAKQLQIPIEMPILSVQRFLHFPQADNAVYSILTCRTDRFDFSQFLGGVGYENTGIL